MQQRIGVGVLGLGSIGTSHARALQHLSDLAHLVAYSGGNSERAAEAGWPQAEQLAPEDLLTHPGVDVVTICSPSDGHGPQAIAALRAGKHVVVEKPLALTVTEAERVVALAADSRRVLSVISQRRLEPEYAAVKEMLTTGQLGQVRLATTHVHWWRDDDYYAAAPWRSQMDAGGGSVMNQGVHNIDLLNWLCGPVGRVTAQYATLGHDIDAEDTTVATVQFTSGALGLISTSTATPPGAPATVSIYTDRGTIELGQGEVLRWDVDAPNPAAMHEDTGPASGASDPAAIGVAGHVTQWRDVLAAITEGREPQITGQDGAQTVRLMAAIYHAARTGTAVAPEELS